jgi:hypothetical protein
MMSPNVKIVWVTDLTYNPASPSTAILTGVKAFDISCAIMAGYTLNPKASDVVSTKSVCQGSNVKAPTRYNYEGKLTFWREGDLTNTTSPYAVAFAQFALPATQKSTGYLVRRIGLNQSVDFAVGQEVSSFLFTTDMPQDAVSTDEIQFTVPFLQQGSMALMQTTVA